MKKATIYIYDEIGWGGITSKDFADSLQQYEDQGAEKFDVHINSRGGSVFDGFAIFNLLKSRDVTIYIDGLAASIASVIALAGKKIYAAKNTFLMIHNPWTLTAGDQEQLKKDSQNLEMIRNTILETYIDKTGKDEETIKDWMNEEKWFTANEALEEKFIDEILDTETVEDFAKNYVALFGHISDDNKNSTKNKLGEKMNKALLAFLGLAENATETEVAAKLAIVKNEFGLGEDDSLSGISDKINNLNTENSRLTTELETVKAELKEIKDAEAEAEKTANEQKVKDLVENAISDFKINAAEKEMYLAFAEKDFDGCKAALDAIKKDAVKGKKLEGKEGAKNSTTEYDDYKNVDSEALELHKKAKAYQEENKVDYFTAVKAVKKEIQ